MKRNKFMAMVAAGALTASIALVGCGTQGQSTQTKETTQTTQTTETTKDTGATKTEEKKDTTATTTNATKQDATATTNTNATTESTSSTTATAPAANTDYIGDEAAKNAALTHAGVAAADCTKLQVSLDIDDNPVHYDVEFKAGGMEYDYDIDPTTGAVLTNKVEVDD